MKRTFSERITLANLCKKYFFKHFLMSCDHRTHFPDARISVFFEGEISSTLKKILTDHGTSRKIFVPSKMGYYVSNNIRQKKSRLN